MNNSFTTKESLSELWCYDSEAPQNHRINLIQDLDRSRVKNRKSYFYLNVNVARQQAETHQFNWRCLVVLIKSCTGATLAFWRCYQANVSWAVLTVSSWRSRQGLRDKQQGGRFCVFGATPGNRAVAHWRWRLTHWQDGTVAPEVLFKAVSVEGELWLLRVAVELCGRQRATEPETERYTKRGPRPDESLTG